MADRKAVNKYYPPDWDPSKGSVNRHNKSHPLRDRAKKISQGILVVRFEMPFSIWCLKCENHIGMGVRYNAEKSKTGNYYSSPIYKFRMKCHLCDNHFEIQTDPAKFDYVILSGARKQARKLASDDADESGQTVLDEEESKRRLTDAMFRLEKKLEDKIRGETELPNLQELKRHQSRWEDSFAANQLLRSQFRARRKKIEQEKSKDKDLLRKTSLRLTLAKPDPGDRLSAHELLKRSRANDCEHIELTNKNRILNSPALRPETSKKAKHSMNLRSKP